MTEIVWHGRGGQGAFTAARILGLAAALYSDTETFALSFPTFGPERRGAPVLGFTKIGSSRISDRSEIDVADFRIYLDNTLLDNNSEHKLKANGTILVNSPTFFSRTENDVKVVSIDASGLACDILGVPIVNTAMLGALAAIWRGISIDSLSKAIRHDMKPSVTQKNIRLLNEAFQRTTENIS